MQSTSSIPLWHAASLSTLVAVVAVAACSAAGDTPPLDVGTAGSGGSVGSAGSGGRGSEIIGGGGKSDGRSGLQAHIERDSVRVEVITLSCLGECADIVAVPTNGEPPYAFKWDDLSTEPKRHVCPSSLTTRYTVTVTDAGVATGEFRRPPQSAKAEVTASAFDCAPKDGGAGGSPSVVPDAGQAPVCASGDTVKGDPLGGTVTYFRQGASVPAGRYRISYVDGCMTYGLDWTIHNIIPPGWLIAGTLTALPGVSGAGFVNFEECVAASRTSAPIEIDFAGGQLGIWNNDYPLYDNRSGIDGRDPTWCLTAL